MLKPNIINTCNIQYKIVYNYADDKKLCNEKKMEMTLPMTNYAKKYKADITTSFKLI